MAEKRAGQSGLEQDPGASAEIGKAVGEVKVNSKAAIDPTAFKELNTEFRKLQGFVTTFKQDLPALIEGTRKWATALNNVAKNMGKVSEAQGGAGGGSYIPAAGSLSAGGTNVGSGNTANPTQIANVYMGGGGGGTSTPSTKSAMGDIAKQLLGAVSQAVDNRIARGASYSLSADKMNMLYQQMSGLSQNQTYHKYREPLQGYRLGMGGINEVLGLQATTGLDARRQAQSIDAMRAASGYAYSTADLAGMTKQMASPEAANMMFMTLGTGMYGLGGTQRTQQQVFQDTIRRSGLTTEAAIKGAMQQGSTVRARLAMSGFTEDQINPMLQYAMQNVQYQKKGGQGFYDPSKKSQRELMGVEGNFASQAEETERVKAQREENFYKRQNDNFAQMERNIQAVNKALGAFEERLSSIVGARVSTKASMAKGALKWGLSLGAGAVAGFFSGGTAAAATTMATKSVLDNVLGDGVTSSPDTSGEASSSSTGGGATTPTTNTSSGNTPPNVRKSEKNLRSLNPRLAARIRKMLEANPNLYVGGGSRTSAEQKALFLSRYVPTDEKTSIKWQGKYWKKKNPNDADAAPPGVSMHEIGMAADIHGDDNWITKHAGEFGLVNFANVNNEPWHVQAKEYNRGQWEYRQAGAPWGLNGGGQDFDPSTELNGETGSAVTSAAIKYTHSGGSSGGGGGGGSGSVSAGFKWADMSMSDVVNAGRRGDGMATSSGTGYSVGSRSVTRGLSAPLSMSRAMSDMVKGPEYNVTIAPNITVTSSGSATVDAHKLAKEVSALLDREVRLSLMRTT